MNWWDEEAKKIEASAEWLRTKAREMAEAINGGDWGRDYTEMQRRGWALKVVWFCLEYPGGMHG